MKINNKEIIYINNSFVCNNAHLSLIEGLKILKEIKVLEISYELSWVKNIFNTDVRVEEFKEIFKLINK